MGSYKNFLHPACFFPPKSVEFSILQVLSTDRLTFMKFMTHFSCSRPQSLLCVVLSASSTSRLSHVSHVQPCRQPCVRGRRTWRVFRSKPETSLLQSARCLPGSLQDVPRHQVCIQSCQPMVLARSSRCTNGWYVRSFQVQNLGRTACPVYLQALARALYTKASK